MGSVEGCPQMFPGQQEISRKIKRRNLTEGFITVGVHGYLSFFFSICTIFSVCCVGS